MITPDIRDLLSKAVDGDLTVAERKRVDQLLRESEPAAKLLQQLQRDAVRMRTLTPVVPPVNIASRVLAEIRDRQVSPTPTPPAPKSRPLNWSQITLWINVATAAGVLLTIGIGSYMYFAISHQAPTKLGEQQIAKGQTRPSKEVVNPQTLPSKSATNQIVEEPIPETLVVAPTPPTLVPSIEQGPQPRIHEENILAAPSEVMPEINAINITKHRISRFVNLAEVISTEAAHAKLQNDIKADLKTDELIRLDLFCRDPKAAMELLTSLLKSKGCQAITDKFLTDRLSKKPATEIVFFTDVMNPDEVFQLIQLLAKEEQKLGSRAGHLDTLVVAPFLPADLDVLGRILGVSSAFTKQLPKQKTPIDIRKPLPEGTANQLAQNLNKLASQSTLKKSKLVFVGSYSPINPLPSQSKEIKQYLEQRSDKRPDAKPLMLVLRTVN